MCCQVTPCPSLHTTLPKPHSNFISPKDILKVEPDILTCHSPYFSYFGPWLHWNQPLKLKYLIVLDSFLSLYITFNQVTNPNPFHFLDIPFIHSKHNIFMENSLCVQDTALVISICLLLHPHDPCSDQGLHHPFLQFVKYHRSLCASFQFPDTPHSYFPLSQNYLPKT